MNWSASDSAYTKPAHPWLRLNTGVEVSPSLPCMTQPGPGYAKSGSVYATTMASTSSALNPAFASAMRPD